MAVKGSAVVTGGASGIGAATAERLAADGYAVAIIDVNAELGEGVAAAIRGRGGAATFYVCDVASEPDVERTASAIAASQGPTDVLVTAAGLIPNSEAVMDMDLAAHDRMWAVNYKGTLFCCRTFARQMIPRRQGAIVTIGSINSRVPLPLPAYNMGKAAVERLTQILAVELGRHRIRVNSVGPTYVLTPPLQAAIKAGKRDLAKIKGVHALDQLPEPKDVAAAIAFLASAEAAAITGVLLPVDAGFLAAVSYRTYAGGVPWSE